MKQRRESIEHFKAGGRDSMVQVEEEESAIIAEFLPQPSPRTRRELVSAAIAESGASSPSDLGKVMGRLAHRSRDAPTARPCPTWCERSSAADPMFIPRTLAETEGVAGEGPGPAP